MMLEDCIDRGNDATSKILTDMLTENTTSQDITPRLPADSLVNGIMENSVLEIEYSGVAEEIIIEDKIYETPPHDNECKDMSGDGEVNKSNNSKENDSVENTNNVIDGIVSQKLLNGYSSSTYDSEENATGNDLNQDIFIDDSKQDHTYHSFSGHTAENNDEVDKSCTAESADKPHKCHICGVLFSRQSSLKGHIRLHIEGPDNMLRNTSITEAPVRDDKDECENLYCCILCNERFPCENTLKCHIKTHMKSNQDADSVTIETNDIVPNEETEPASDDDKRDYKCIICEKSFSRRSSLTCHYKNHPYERTPSSRNQNDIDPVEKETEIDENESRPYKCFKCSKSFARQSSLASHLTLHEINTRKKSSDDSEKRLNVLNESKNCKELVPMENGDVSGELTNGDENINTDEHQCHLCDRSFSQIRGLKRHLLFHRANAEAIVASQAKTAFIPSDIIYEEVSSRKYTCFTKNHQHTEITKLYKCNVCQRCFCDIGNLRRHLTRNHHDESTDAENEVSEEDLKARKRDPGTRDICNDAISSKRHKSSDSMNIIFAGLYKCGICSEAFEEIGSLQDHVTVHLNDQLFRCEICSRAFDANDALENHPCDPTIPQSSADEELVCVVCDLTFSNNSTLKRHMNCHRRVEEEIITKVSSSGRRIKDPRSNREDDWNMPRTKRIPKVNHHEDIPTEKANEEVVVCDCCNRTFPNERARRIHLYYRTRNTKDNSVSPVSQPEPEKPPVVNAPEQKTELNQKNSNLDSLKCSCCDKLFTSIRALTNHVSGVTDNAAEEMSPSDTNSLTNMIKCDRCDRFFFGIRALKMHINDHIRKVVPPLEPSAVDEPMETQNDRIDRNETVDSSSHQELIPEATQLPEESQVETLPTCDICNRTFATARALGIHKSYHLACCGKTFLNQRALNIHKSRHTNEEFADDESDEDDDPLKCHCCDKIFATKHTLKVHLMRKAKRAEEDEESDDDVFVSLTCDICDKTFKSNKSMRKHRETHDEADDDEGEFECPKCSKQFISARSLAVHKAFHTKSERIQEAEAEAEANGKVYVVLAGGNFKCRFCDRFFDSLKAVCRHYAAHKKTVEGLPDQATDEPIVENAEHKCTKCDRSFASGNALGGHMKYHTISEERDQNEEKENDGEHRCSKCDRSFASGNALGGHMNSHRVTEAAESSESEESEEVECKECDRTFMSKKALYGHLSSHRSKGSYRHSLTRKNGDTLRSEQDDQCAPEVEATEQSRDDSGEKFQCDKCDRAFSSVVSLRGHNSRAHYRKEFENDRIESVTEKATKDEPPVKVYQCKYCDRSFNNMFGFAGHCSAHRKSTRKSETEKSVELSCMLENAAETDGVEQAKCDICEVNFDDLKSLAKHVQEHKVGEAEDRDTKKPAFECPSCGREFEKEIGLKRHSIVHKNDNLDPDNSAQSESIDMISSIDHSMTQSDTIDGVEVESFVETSCIDQSMNRTDTIVNSDVESIVDGSTDVTLNETDEMEQTSQIETPVATPVRRELQCEICFRLFDNQKALKRHNMWHKFNDFAEEPESTEIHKCTRCDKILDNEEALQRHLTFHGTLLNGSKADMTNIIVKCDLCNELFDRVPSLKSHWLEVHGKALTTGVKFKCNFCDKRFTKPKALRMHLRFHPFDNSSSDVDLMPFECISCEKCFRLKDDLLEHVKTHADAELDDETLEQVNEMARSQFEDEGTLCDDERPALTVESKQSNRGVTENGHVDEAKTEKRNDNVADNARAHHSKIEHRNDNAADDARADQSNCNPSNDVRAGDSSKIEHPSYNSPDDAYADETKIQHADRRTSNDVQADKSKSEHFAHNTTLDEPKHVLLNHNTNDPSPVADEYLICDDVDDFELRIDDENIDSTNDDEAPIGTSKKNAFSCTVCNKVFQKRCNLGTHRRIHNKKAKVSPIKATVVLPTQPHKCALCNMTFRLKSTLVDHYQSHETPKRKRALKRHSNDIAFDEGAQSSKKSQTK